MQRNAPFGLLIADSDDAFRESVKRNLGRSVVVVGEAREVEEAVHMSRRLHPDVVLMDIALPVLGGIEAARRIKADRPRTKVVLLTSGEQLLQLDGGGLVNADGVLTKASVVSEIHSRRLDPGALKRRPRP